MPDRWPFRFRPQRGPTLVVIPCLLILLGLSFWQLQRHEWKAALIAEREAQMDAPALLLPARIAEPQVLSFRHVRAEGCSGTTRNCTSWPSRGAATTGIRSSRR